MSIPGAAAYVESEINEIIDLHHIDLYRHDQNGIDGGEDSSTLRDGFMENDYWRHYEAFYSMMERIHQQRPQLILQQAAAGGCRLDLATASRFHEHFTSDQVSYPHVYQAAAGLSVFRPPEEYVVSNGMAGNNRDQPDFTTMVRSVYTLGNTPRFFNMMLPSTVQQYAPADLTLLNRYATFYKQVIRPLLPTLKVWHHGPVNGTAGVESGPWFVMEFSSPDKTLAWATIIRLNSSAGASYFLSPKGLDTSKQYKITFDNSGTVQQLDGATLMNAGLNIPVPANPASEWVLFQAQ
jgi:alpha-galactosidase